MEMGMHRIIRALRRPTLKQWYQLIVAVLAFGLLFGSIIAAIVLHDRSYFIAVWTLLVTVYFLAKGVKWTTRTSKRAALAIAAAARR